MDIIKFRADWRYIILFAFFIFSPTLQGAALASYIFFYGIPMLYLIINYKVMLMFFRRMDLRNFACYSGILLLILLSILVPAVSGTDDYTYVNTTLSLVRALVKYLFLAVIIWKNYKSEQACEIFMLYFCYSVMLYVLGTFFFLAVPSAWNMCLRLVSSEEFSERIFGSFGYATRIGWMGFSGFRCTIRSSIAVLFLLTLRYNPRLVNKLNNTRFIPLLGFALIGNAFYGRSGIIVSAAVIVSSAAVYRVVSAKKIIGALVGFGALLFLFVGLSKVSPLLNDWYVWMTTPFKQGIINSHSVQHNINDMLFKPEFKTMLIGDGKYTNADNSYYMHSDLGFMRKILFWGLPITIIAYILTILTSRTLGRKYTSLLIPFVCLFAIFEFKGETYQDLIPLMLSLGFLIKISHLFEARNLKENVYEFR